MGNVGEGDLELAAEYEARIRQQLARAERFRS
jgi:hypothetical protein